MSRPLPLLIVGAGPFGLAMARYARLRGIEHRIVGRPMSFWRENMPEGMVLRSGTSWHLDPAGELTFDAWIQARALASPDVRPLPLDRYLDYVEWYRERAGIEVEDVRVDELSLESPSVVESGGGVDDRLFRARLSDGSETLAANVFLALGFGYFTHVPDELARVVPRERWVHSAELVDLRPLRGERIFIVGGRQSAFETAALAAEAGAERVWLSHRHPSPEITGSDWSWVEAMVSRMIDDPGWYRRLPEGERATIDRRFWEEGRLKVEPWLGPRLATEVVKVLPETRVVGASESPEGLAVRLASGADRGGEAHEVVVDRVVLATGYRVDMTRVPFLAPSLLDRLGLIEGFPPLDEGFQSRVPGLFITSMPATRDFGPFLAFTVSVRAATRVAGRAIDARIGRADYPSSTPVHEPGASP